MLTVPLGDWLEKKSTSYNHKTTMWPHQGKTLKSQFLKKPLIEFNEIQDLSSPIGKPKLLFYDYSWCLFFSSQSPRGTTLNHHIINLKDHQGLYLAVCSCFCKVRFGTT